MDRKAIHDQISGLLDKLTFLNERLSQEKSLHPVEIDLLQGYLRELQTAMDSLGKAKAELHVVAKDTGASQPVAEEKAEPAMEHKSVLHVEKDTEPVAEKKADSELKMHQHILEKAETAKIPDDPEAFLEEDKKAATTPHVKMEAPEEILARKKSFVKPEEKETPTIATRFKKEAPALADKLKGAKKKSLKDMFDLNERYAFIENLFGGSAEQFNRAVQDLGRCSSREQAEQYMKDVEVKYSWGEKPELAQRFSGQVLELIG